MYFSRFQAVFLCSALAFCTVASAQVFTQQGIKLVDAGPNGKTFQGGAVALSSDGNTALIGLYGDNSYTGAAAVFTRDSSGTWTQQGSKLIGSGAITPSQQGQSVALSSDGNTALVGGPADHGAAGAVWVFTRDGSGNWTQQGNKLIGSGATSPSQQGQSVALSSDGNTALVGGPGDANGAGAVWVFTRDANGNWTQQGSKLVGTGGVGQTEQGFSVTLSSDGNTAFVGGPLDNSSSGASWVFTRDVNGNWTQQGSKLAGTGAVGAPQQGRAVALSADGNTAVVGGPNDNTNVGAMWVFARDGNGHWSQQGNKLVGTEAVGQSEQGFSVALSADGNTALEGGPFDASAAGAAWAFTRSSGVWTQQGNKLLGMGAVGNAEQGTAVALSGGGTTALIGGPDDNSYTGAVWPFVQATAGQPMQFVPIKPCRLVDTRLADGPFGGPELVANTTRTFNLPASNLAVSPCENKIPANAAAYALNVTVVPDAQLGYLTIWPTGQSQPLVSTLNSDGRIKADAAIVPAGTNGSVNVFVTNSTHLVLDINGYFVPAGTSTLQFYPVTPCRVADTRLPQGALSGPYLTGGLPRVFPVISSECNIPSSAQAYSLNFTAVPHGPLGFITVWPTRQGQPYVSTLNALNGGITANAAIVPAGSSGDISVYATGDTDLVIDVNGYFAPPGSGGLSLRTVPPCRVLDTRTSSGALTGGPLTVDVAGSSCGALTAGAQALVLNATVVPNGTLGYLALWPDGVTQPLVSTLNALDGATTANMALVPTTNGSIDSFANGTTQLILDLSGYFAP